ncbi:MAG TPA: DUF4402 domain-containing protein [Sphingomicrobium sp.]|nr:DUF4402 domain-containing protein [Sphingomicrobium sp.]
MSGLRFALLSPFALLVGAFAMPGAAPAQCRLCDTPTTSPDQTTATMPIRLEVQARLDFDQVLLLDSTLSGTARIAPDGSSSTSGSIGTLSGRAMVGSVIVRGEPGRLVRIGFPDVISLYGLGGSSIRLRALISDLPAMARLDSHGMLRFRFGGEIEISGNAEGNFRGDVPITVDYL